MKKYYFKIIKNIEILILSVVGILSLLWSVFPDCNLFEPIITLVAVFFAFIATKNTIKNTNHTKYLYLIISNSNPIDDWYRNTIYNRGSSHIAVYKNDPSVKIIKDNEALNEDYKEEWLNKRFPDSSVSSYNVSVETNGNEIDNFIILSVDGARGFIPQPSFKELKTDSYKVAICQILQGQSFYDTSYYIKRTEIQIDEII